MSNGLADQPDERQTQRGGGLLGYATDAECIGACLRRIGHLELVMRECCDAIRDNDEFGAVRMLEIALKPRNTTTEKRQNP